MESNKNGLGVCGRDCCQKSVTVGTDGAACLLCDLMASYRNSGWEREGSQPADVS